MPLAVRARRAQAASGWPIRGTLHPQAGRCDLPTRVPDLGELATIGRLRAVADFRVVRVSGIVAWFLWLAIHIFWLIGLQNRALVMLRWVWSFLTRGRGNRLITGSPRQQGDAESSGRTG
jgi:NADH dehydrogenase